MNNVYRSVNQNAKNTINRILADTVTARDLSNRIITLDDIDNGTCRIFYNSGYKGSLRVVQRNTKILSDQFEQGTQEFSTADFNVYHGDICKHFVDMSRFWVLPSPCIDLYNFDF